MKQKKVAPATDEAPTQRDLNEAEPSTKRSNATPPASETRPAIAQMSGFSSMEELGKEIPASTMTAEPQRKKRGPNKPKTPPDPQLAANPLMEDKRYRDAVAGMAAFGGSKTIETAFASTGKPLDATEKKQLDDLTYVASKQYPSLDPSRSPWLMGFYTLMLFAQFIMVRVMGTSSANIWGQFRGIFGKEDEAKESE